MTSIEERCELIRQEGIEHVLIQPFTTELARLTPEEFATRFLRDGLGAKWVIVGENFRFGCKQAGDTKTLKELGSRLGFEVRLLDTVQWRGRRVSSGEIRKLVASGRRQSRRTLTRTARMRSRAKSSADTASGRSKLSRRLNLRTEAQVIPARGVYVTRTMDLDGERSGIPSPISAFGRHLLTTRP